MSGLRCAHGLGLATLLCVALALTAAPLFGVATITLVNQDPPGQGFNDPTPVAPVFGNPGTTLGQQRLNAFQAAANLWANLIEFNQDIRIDITMPNLDCDAFSALLGAAGPTSVFGNFPNVPVQNTWYVSALADGISGTDRSPGNPDIEAEFNAALDAGNPGCLGGTKWWYGIGAAPPGQDLDFVNTVLHEIAHGLGFLSLVDLETGQKFMGFDDAFMRHLRDNSSGIDFPDMSNGQRAAASINDGNLVWTGANVTAKANQFTAGVNGGRIRMYAPNPIEQGSSGSHFDTEVFPNELMEPFDTADSADLITTDLLEDIGWSLGGNGGGGPCVEDATTLCLGAGERFRVKVTWRDSLNATGNGNAVPFSESSGLLWFFSADNIEMLIKVLDGCGFNNNYWVFFAATTDVEFTVTVTDTVANVTKVYGNTLGQPADAVTDTAAFATCPRSPAQSSRLTWHNPTVGGEDIERIAHSDLADRVSEEQDRLRQTLAMLQSTAPRAGEGSAVETAVAPPRRGSTRVRPVSTDLLGRRFAADRFPADRAAVDVAPADVHSVGAGVATPEGTVYDYFVGEGLPNGNVFSLYDANNPDTRQTFDSQTESQTPLLDGTVPRVRESVTVRASGDAVDVNITVFSRGGEDLFPAGFTGNGQALTDAALILGTFNNALPLTFDNLGVFQASLTLKRNNSTVDVIDFGPGTGNPFELFFFEDSNEPWQGNFAVLVPGLAGMGVDTVELDIRIAVTPDVVIVPPFNCVEDARTLCLNGDRFQARLTWTDFANNTGLGSAVDISGSDTSGLFWFFNADNIEMLLKVLDGCGFNNRYWVFFAATTDVAFELTVIDSDTGVVKTYTNPLGQPASAITDTSAFATCP